MSAALPTRVVIGVDFAGNTQQATITAPGAVRIGDVITTGGGTYRVTDVLDDSPAPHNRHQRGAALAKWRKRHAHG